MICNSSYWFFSGWTLTKIGWHSEFGHLRGKESSIKRSVNDDWHWHYWPQIKRPWQSAILCALSLKPNSSVLPKIRNSSCFSKNKAICSRFKQSRRKTRLPQTFWKTEHQRITWVVNLRVKNKQDKLSLHRSNVGAEQRNRFASITENPRFPGLEVNFPLRGTLAALVT